MNSILKYFIQNLPINLSCKIEKIKRNIKSWNLYDTEGNCYGPFDYVVLTTPPRQTEALLHENFKYTDIIRKIIMRSCFSIMLGFSKDKRLEFDAALFHDEDLAWLSVNKTFSNKQAYYNILINSSYDFAENNKNYSTDRIFNHLTQKVSNILNFNYDNYNYKAVHYWRYAMCEKINNYGSFFDDNLSLLVCGDWCMAGNVEGAFLSALDAAKKLKTYL